MSDASTAASSAARRPASFAAAFSTRVLAEAAHGDSAPGTEGGCWRAVSGIGRG